VVYVCSSKGFGRIMDISGKKNGRRKRGRWRTGFLWVLGSVGCGWVVGGVGLVGFFVVVRRFLEDFFFLAWMGVEMVWGWWVDEWDGWFAHV
jgi:hypothetical protein